MEKWRAYVLSRLPFGVKLNLSRLRVRQWHDQNNAGVYVSFSGGRDSTVLLHLVRSMFPWVPAVFCDTGLEFPEVRDFAMANADVVLKPKMPFTKVIETYGWPVVSKEVAQKIHEARTTMSMKLLCKRLFGDNNRYRSGKIPEKWRPLLHAPFLISHRCCDVMKKRPAHRYEKETGRVPYLGTMAADSHFRKQSWLRHGCNSHEGRPRSMPLAFWTQRDILTYVGMFDVPVAKVYDMGYEHTGCVFCAFGVHRESKPNKFERMKVTHPNLHNYCINKLGMREVLSFLKVPFGED